MCFGSYGRPCNNNNALFTLITKGHINIASDKNYIFDFTWVKPVCCVSKISSDCGCQSKEIGVGMEVRLLSVGTRGFFSPLPDSPSRLRRSILSPPTRKKNLWHPGYFNTNKVQQNSRPNFRHTAFRNLKRNRPVLARC